MIVMRYMKMLLLSLIFLSLAPSTMGGSVGIASVTTRRENFYRVAILILLYSSIVGYDRHAIISLGRGISIYGGLFLLQLRLIINYINSLFKIGFRDHTSSGGPAL